LQKQQAKKLEQMSQQYANALAIIPMLNLGDAHKLANELLKGLPGQRAYEERQQRKKREEEAENNNPWRALRHGIAD
jgi:hypothetical protein